MATSAPASSRCRLFDETYDSISCSGPVFAASDYAAVYQKRAYDELVKINQARVDALNHDLKAAIEKRFGDLPRDVQQLAAIQSLKRSLNDYLDQRLRQAPPRFRHREGTVPAALAPGLTPPSLGRDREHRLRITSN